MAKTLIVAGYGQGISDAVAKKFGSEGFALALVARNRERLEAGVARLEATGMKAAAFPADLGDPKAVRDVISKVRDKLGDITVVHWNAFAIGAGDLAKAEAAEVRAVFDVSVTGLVTAVRESLADLKKAKNAAVLVTGGGLCMYDQNVDAMAVTWGAMGLAVAKAAQHKTAGLLAERLRQDGIFVGEVVVLGLVKGTAFDTGKATLEPSAIANRFWQLYSERKEHSVTFG